MSSPTTRRASGPAILILSVSALALAGCSPGLPKGVEEDKLNDEVSRAIGDPSSCLLLADQASGRTIWRYNSHLACDRHLPACDHPGERKIDQLLKDTLKDGQPRQLSCNSLADASRGVGWASGVLPKYHVVYAAMMEGTRSFPGRMMAERLADSFAAAGL